MKPSSMSSSSTVPANRMPMAVRGSPAAAASSQSMIRSAMSAPYLEREEERALAIRWKETKDQDALHRITSAHMRLVISMAGRFRKFKLPMSDLIQEGYVGLLEAAARFDPRPRCAFFDLCILVDSCLHAGLYPAQLVYRSWWHKLGAESTVFNLRRLRSKLAQTDDNMTKAEIYREISDQLGVSTSDVEFMDSRLSGPDSSLSAPMNGEETGASRRMDFLVDDHPLQDEIAESSIDMERRNRWLHARSTR